MNALKTQSFTVWCEYLERKQVYAWGRGDFGQLGNGIEANANTPKHVKALDAYNVVDISGGDNFILLLTGMCFIFHMYDKYVTDISHCFYFVYCIAYVLT